MIAAVLAVVALQSQVQPLWKEKGLSLTGKNGYEEYLAAADVAKAREFGVFLRQSSPTRPPFSPHREDPNSTDPLEERLSKLTQLEVKREMVEKFSIALDLVAQGNAKPCRIDGSGWTIDTAFPELSCFRYLSRLASIRADVAYADGESGAAATAWCDMLTMTDRMGRGGTLIHSLVGISSRAIILANVAGHLERLSVTDCHRLDSAAKDLLGKPAMLIAGLAGEFRFNDSLLGGDLEKALGIVLPSDMEDSDETSQTANDLVTVKAMSPNEQRALAERVCARLRKAIDAVSTKLRGPESGWIALEETTAAKTLEDRIVDAFSPVYGQTVSSEACSRTQLRLLRLHAAIQEYKLAHSELPENLNAFPKALTFDPIAQKPFVYKSADGLYEVYSVGWPAVGRIDLRYSRPTTPGGTDPIDPTR